ncbi:MAG: hypothetical protein H8E17_09535 [Deltaproteobacteria bacterium]|nr:hypothetical protein [Deltaproteobacteria bacterium]
MAYKKVRFSFFSLLILLLFSGIIHADDLQEGILGLNWGTNISGLGYLERLYTKNQVDFYINPNEVPTIYGISIPNAVYGFHSDRFFAAYLNIDTIEIFTRFKKDMNEKYGAAKISMTAKDEQTIYKWNFKNIKIKLKLSEKDGRMKLAFYYTPISKGVNEQQQEMYNEKSYRFLPIEKDKKFERITPLLIF